MIINGDGKTTLRYDTEANWSSVNPLLEKGEMIVVALNGQPKIKCGDGINRYNNLPFLFMTRGDEMLRISYNNIFITRGDTGVINFELEDYELQNTDRVVLTVKQNTDTSEILLQKELDYATNQFVIMPEDTSNLEYGKYVYDVQITTGTGEVYTVITPHKFEVGNEVTW